MKKRERKEAKLNFMEIYNLSLPELRVQWKQSTNRAHPFFQDPLGTSLRRAWPTGIQLFVKRRTGDHHFFSCPLSPRLKKPSSFTFPREEPNLQTFSVNRGDV